MNALRSKTEPGYVAPTSKPATAGAQGVNFWDAINPFKAPESAEARAARIARNEERALETEARRRREEEAEARRRAENAARREERVTADAARIKLQLAVDAAAAALTKDANLFKWSGEARRAAILAEFEAVIEALPLETNEASLSRTDQTSAKEAQAELARVIEVADAKFNELIDTLGTLEDVLTDEGKPSRPASCRRCARAQSVSRRRRRRSRWRRRRRSRRRRPRRPATCRGGRRWAARRGRRSSSRPPTRRRRRRRRRRRGQPRRIAPR